VRASSFFGNAGGKARVYLFNTGLLALAKRGLDAWDLTLPLAENHHFERRAPVRGGQWRAMRPGMGGIPGNRGTVGSVSCRI